MVPIIIITFLIPYVITNKTSMFNLSYDLLLIDCYISDQLIFNLLLNQPLFLCFGSECLIELYEEDFFCNNYDCSRCILIALELPHSVV
jgi:hypothetical protein